MKSTEIPVTLASEYPRARPPKVGDMVRVNGCKGLFLVTGVDKLSRLARLGQRVGRGDFLEQDVPFQEIQTVADRASKAIRHFLGSKALKSGAPSRTLPV